MPNTSEKMQHKPSTKHTLEEVLSSLQDLIRNDLPGSGAGVTGEKPSGAKTKQATESPRTADKNKVLSSLRNLLHTESDAKEMGGHAESRIEPKESPTEKIAATSEQEEILANDLDAFSPLGNEKVTEEAFKGITSDAAGLVSEDEIEFLDAPLEPLLDDVTPESPGATVVPTETTGKVPGQPVIEELVVNWDEAGDKSVTPEIEINDAPLTNEDAESSDLLSDEAALANAFLDSAPPAEDHSLDETPQTELPSESTAPIEEELVSPVSSESVAAEDFLFQENTAPDEIPATDAKESLGKAVNEAGNNIDTSIDATANTSGNTFNETIAKGLIEILNNNKGNDTPVQRGGEPIDTPSGESFALDMKEVMAELSRLVETLSSRLAGVEQQTPAQALEPDSTVAELDIYPPDTEVSHWFNNVPPYSNVSRHVEIKEQQKPPVEPEISVDADSSAGVNDTAAPTTEEIQIVAPAVETDDSVSITDTENTAESFTVEEIQMGPAAEPESPLVDEASAAVPETEASPLEEIQAAPAPASEAEGSDDIPADPAVETDDSVSITDTENTAESFTVEEIQMGPAAEPESPLVDEASAAVPETEASPLEEIQAAPAPADKSRGDDKPAKPTLELSLADSNTPLTGAASTTTETTVSTPETNPSPKTDTLSLKDSASDSPIASEPKQTQISPESAPDLTPSNIEPLKIDPTFSAEDAAPAAPDTASEGKVARAAAEAPPDQTPTDMQSLGQTSMEWGDDIPVLANVAAPGKAVPRPAKKPLKRKPTRTAKPANAHLREVAIKVVAKMNIDLRKRGERALAPGAIDQLQKLLREALDQKQTKDHNKK